MAAAQAQLAQMKLLGVGLCGPRKDVDRRNCQRVVPMEVLCLGMPRTGTASMRMALLQLGLADVYHMVELWEENPKDDDLWVEAYQAKYDGKGKEWGRKEWDALLGHCMAVSDLPAISFAEDLIAAYPEAKVILTIRDSPSAWHESMANTIWTGAFIFGSPKSLLQRLVQRVVPRPECWRTLQYAYTYTVGDDFPTNGKQAYLQHNEMVRKLVPKERLLEFNVKQGWGPLCEFLGREAPEAPFPRVNDTKSWQTHVAKSKMKGAANALKVVGGVATILVGIYLGLRGWGQ